MSHAWDKVAQLGACQNTNAHGDHGMGMPKQCSAPHVASARHFRRRLWLASAGLLPTIHAPLLWSFPSRILPCCVMPLFSALPPTMRALDPTLAPSPLSSSRMSRHSDPHQVGITRVQASSSRATEPRPAHSMAILIGSPSQPIYSHPWALTSRETPYRIFLSAAYK